MGQSSLVRRADAQPVQAPLTWWQSPRRSLVFPGI
jgi:hypothetical protein